MDVCLKLSNLWWVPGVDQSRTLKKSWLFFIFTFLTVEGHTQNQSGAGSVLTQAGSVVIAQIG